MTGVAVEAELAWLPAVALAVAPVPEEEAAASGYGDKRSRSTRRSEQDYRTARICECSRLSPHRLTGLPGSQTEVTYNERTGAYRPFLMLSTILSA